MATHSRGRTETMVAKKNQQEKETSPERRKIWIEPKQKCEQKVSVIYYLSRNGQLDHPHLLEIPHLSSPQGLYLRDVMNRLNFLRGQGMANMYSWSAKRSYKNGYAWQDLSENDFINPCHGTEYVLKGSKILEHSSSVRSCETMSSSSAAKKSYESSSSSSEDSNSPATVRRKNHSWSSTFDDVSEYKIYKSMNSINASTQTNDGQRQRRLKTEEVESSRGEVSPRPLDFSSDAIESLKSRVHLDKSADIRDQTTDNDRPSGRIKASMVLKQLITCGSKRDEDCVSITED